MNVGTLSDMYTFLGKILVSVCTFVFSLVFFVAGICKVKLLQ